MSAETGRGGRGGVSSRPLSGWVSRSVEATERAGAELARALRAGDLIALSGPLGAGKSRLVAGLARGLGCPAPVRSPTFTLINQYSGRLTLFHADLYRVSHTGELAELGVDEAAENAVVLLEWPDRAEDVLPPDRLDIAFTLAPNLGINQRNAEITGHGAFAPRIERLAALRHFLLAEGVADASAVGGDAARSALPRARRAVARPPAVNARRASLAAAKRCGERGRVASRSA